VCEHVDSLEVKVLYPPDGGEGLVKRKALSKAASERSVEQHASR